MFTRDVKSNVVRLPGLVGPDLGEGHVHVGPVADRVLHADVQLAFVQVDVGGESAEDEGRCEDQCDESASHVHPPDVRLHRSALRLVERPSKRGRRESFMALGRFSGAMRMPRAARAYDAGYIAIYRSGVHFSDTSRPTTALVRFIDRMHPGGRALELGCGEGRDAIFLARRGLQVTAIDASSSALSRAPERPP